MLLKSSMWRQRTIRCCDISYISGLLSKKYYFSLGKQYFHPFHTCIHTETNRHAINASSLHNTLSCKGCIPQGHAGSNWRQTGTCPATILPLCPLFHTGFEPATLPRWSQLDQASTAWYPAPWCYHWYPQACFEDRGVILSTRQSKAMTHSVPLSSQYHLVWVTCTWVALQESASRGDHMADWQRDETQPRPNRHGERDISKYFFYFGIWWIAAYFSCVRSHWILDPSCWSWILFKIQNP